jgi:hypothetical protein
MMLIVTLMEIREIIRQHSDVIGHGHHIPAGNEELNLERL